ncbi:MAG: DNA primase [Phycisphaerae bacterium]|nr:DNA primase [Phycisphaerae bacterium]
MAKIGPDNDNKRRVLEATDIVRLVGEHVTLKPKGREFACVCPFHNDHNPSMYVVPAKQIFHCFVCNAGGNALDFVMRFHGMGFREALEMLASRAGLTLQSSRRADAAPDEAASSREQIIEANAAAMRFFRGILSHAEHGAAARDVIERRGISPAMVETFGLGAAPDRWDGLVQYAESKGLPQQALIDAGLIKRREHSAGCYDLLRHRLVFPIFDRIGRAVAFGGRKIREEDEPKYLNSPESKVFDKGATLFGVKQALRSIQAERTAVVTEGYTDVIACHQHGFTNVVATLGTALTPKHASALRGVCDTLILLFDGDEAGQRAADRALEVFFNEPIDVRIAVMVGGKDPDELLKKDPSGESFRAVLAGAVDFLTFRFQRLGHRLDERGQIIGSNARATAIENEIDRLVELGLRRLPPIRQQTVIARLTSLAGVDGAAVIAALNKSAARPIGGKPAVAASSASGPVRETLEHLIGCLLVEPHLAETHFAEAQDVLEAAAYSSPPLAAVAKACLASIACGDAPSLTEVLLELEDSEARQLATTLASETDRLTDGAHDRVAEHWRCCLNDRATKQSTDLISKSTDANEKIEHMRRLQSERGGNPRALPRPRAVPLPRP